MFEMSQHCVIRAAQRSLTAEEIEYVLQFGKRYYCKGALVYYLRYKDLPRDDLRRDQWTDLVGSGVVLSSDHQVVITVWRNRKKGLKMLRKKPEAFHREFAHKSPVPDLHIAD